jgi:hypothetical protein
VPADSAANNNTPAANTGTGTTGAAKADIKTEKSAVNPPPTIKTIEKETQNAKT